MPSKTHLRQRPGAINWSSLPRLQWLSLVVGVSAGRRRHGHVGVRDDPHVAVRDGRGHVRRGHGLHGDDDARGLDAQLCGPDVLHVVGHDGGDDAAQRGADDPFIRRSIASSAKPAIPMSRRAYSVLGYLAAWAGFSLIAVILQWGSSGPVSPSPMLVGTNVIFEASCCLLRVSTNSHR